jgi:putative DNA primase/helicase
MTLPNYRKVISENIPDELKKKKIWTVWKPVSNGKRKPQKVPMSLQVNKVTGLLETKAASCNNPETWMTFEDALELLKSSKKFKGLAIALSPEPPQECTETLVGIDIDNSLLPDGTIDPERLEELKRFNTYTELSPSEINGGLRAFCYGSFPVNEGVHSGNTEIYQYGKFLSITGHKLSDFPATINVAQESLMEFRAKYFKSTDEIKETELPVTNIKFTDEELIEHLLNFRLAEKFKEMYYYGAKEGEDYSVKDKDLCKLITFWTQDIEQIDRIFRKSKLFRPEKWDKRHFSNGDTYGQGTIKYALRTRKDVYQAKGLTDNLNVESFNLNMYPFSVKENGIYREISSSRSEESVTVQIASTPCIIVAIGENVDNGEILYKLKIKDIRGHEKYVWKSTSDLMKKSEILKLQENGLHFKESKANDLIDFFDKFINTYNDKLVSEFAASVGGWKKNFSIYVIGNKAIKKDGVSKVLQLDNPTANFFCTKGSIEGWVEGAKYIVNYPAVRFKLYNSCVAPLIRILYMTSYILDNHVESGRLKSDSNWLAASMWGDPISQQAGGNSSQVGILNLISYCTDIPTFLDETSQNPEAARKLAYSVGNVGGRLTGRTDGKRGLVVPPASATVLLATGEHPIVPVNSNGGEDVRVMSLTEGVYDELSGEDVINMEMLMRENYGHIVVPFIQEILKLKDHIRDMFSANLAALPAVSGISENRVKKQYAAIATAGEILERVFESIGISTMNPIEVCTKYFEINVMSEGFIPDHIKALNVAYHWYITNEIYFQEEIINHTQYGWIKEDQEIDDQLICFDEDQLRKQIISSLGPNRYDRYESAVNKWRDLEIVKVRKIDEKDKDGNKTGKVKILKTIQITVNKRKITVIAIPLKNFYKCLSISENSNYTGTTTDHEVDSTSTRPVYDNTDESESKVSAITANVPMSSSSEFNQVTTVTADSGIGDSNIFVTSSDLEAYEIMKKEGLY